MTLVLDKRCILDVTALDRPPVSSVYFL